MNISNVSEIQIFFLFTIHLKLYFLMLIVQILCPCILFNSSDFLTDILQALNKLFWFFFRLLPFCSIGKHNFVERIVYW